MLGVHGSDMVDGIKNRPRVVPPAAQAETRPAVAADAPGAKGAIPMAVLDAPRRDRAAQLLAVTELAKGTRLSPPEALKLSLDLKTWSPNEMRRALLSDLERCFTLIAKLPPATTFFGGARILAGDPYFDAARELGFRLARIGIVVRTGAGPGIMDAGPEGQKKAGFTKDPSTLTQGIRVSLPFEQEWSEHIDAGAEALMFAFRKLALYDDAPAVLTWPGGFGTLDELFEVWAGTTTGVFDKEVAVYGKDFYEPILGAFRGMVERGFTSAEAFGQMRILDDVDSATKWAEDAFATKPATKMGPRRMLKLAREIDESIALLDRLEPGVLFLGGRELSAKDPELGVGRDVAAKIAAAGVPTRVGSTGIVAAAVGEGVRSVDRTATVQGVILEGGPGEDRYVPNLRVHQTTNEPVVHKETIGRRTRAIVVLPGGLNTMGELFAVLTQIQVGHMPKVPLVLVGRSFWEPIVQELKQHLYNDTRKLIAADDLDLITRIVDDADEAADVLLQSPAPPAPGEPAHRLVEGVVFEGDATMRNHVKGPAAPWLAGDTVGDGRVRTTAPAYTAESAHERISRDLQDDVVAALAGRGVDPRHVAHALDVGVPPRTVVDLFEAGAGKKAYEFLYAVEPYAGRYTGAEYVEGLLARWGTNAETLFDRFSYLVRSEDLMNPEALRTWIQGALAEGVPGAGMATMTLDAVDLLRIGHKIWIEEHPLGFGDIVDETTKTVYQHKRVLGSRLSPSLREACDQLAGTGREKAAPPGYAGVAHMDLRGNPSWNARTDEDICKSVADTKLDPARLDRVQVLLDDRLLVFDRDKKLVEVRRSVRA
jgi:uncharacterized protein (TIGR00730 family)